MKREKYKPAKQTITNVNKIKQWHLGKFVTSKFYGISKTFPILKLRGATVYITGPDSWERAKTIGNVTTVKNKKFMVQLKHLAEGKTSLKYKPGYQFVISPKQLVEIY